MKHPALPRTILFVLAAAVIRVAMLPLSTADYDIYQLPWLQHAEKVHGGYLTSAFTNYTAFYEHVLALLALFPGPELLRIKLFAIGFDLVLAYAVSLIVPPGKRGLAFGVVLIVPSIAVNSALWGQAESIYTSMVIFSLAAALRNRPVWAMLAFSAAIAIKLQAVMFAPVLALLFLERRQPLWTFALIPLAYLGFALPMLLAGRPLDQVFLVYSGQYETYRSLSLNAPNPWMILRKIVDYRVGVLIGLPLAAGTLGAAVLWFWRSRFARHDEGLLLAAALVLLLAPYLAPKMHERYFYMAMPVLVALACRQRAYLLPLVLAETATLLAYAPFVTLKYANDNWLLGQQGYLQRTYGFGFGVFPAIGALVMSGALALLIARAVAMRSTFKREEASATGMQGAHTQ